MIFLLAFCFLNWLAQGEINVGLPSGKSLFQLHVERVHRLKRLANRYGFAPSLPIYIMTSSKTHERTVQFFAKNDYFGLAHDQIIFFQQGDEPSLDEDGKLILQTKSSIASSPDGNGGLFSALSRNGIIADMKSRGITYVHICSIDNVLASTADPELVGYCDWKNAQAGAKVMQKVSLGFSFVKPLEFPAPADKGNSNLCPLLSRRILTSKWECSHISMARLMSLNILNSRRRRRRDVTR